ncbi:hypothetical protein KWT84_06245 [Clostridioides difficile]|nr:hypothetical protein [Clostridioides difficile]
MGVRNRARKTCRTYKLFCSYYERMLRKRNGTFSFTITTLKVGLDEMLRSQEKVSASRTVDIEKNS